MPQPAPARAPADSENGVPVTPDPANFRKRSAYTTAVKKRRDAVRDRIANFEAQRWEAEMQVATLEAQLAAIGRLDGDLKPEGEMVTGVADELRRQRIMIVSLDAALEAVRSLDVPEPDREGVAS